MTNYYDVLGLKKSATLEDIKKNYRKKSLQYHPDKTINLPPKRQADATSMMQKLSEAYAVLSDTTRRSEYDNQLKTQKNRFKIFTPQSGRTIKDKWGRQSSVTVFHVLDNSSGTAAIEVYVDKANVVDFINAFEAAIKKFEETPQKSTNFHEIVSKLDRLICNLSQYKEVLSGTNVSFAEYMTALTQCQALIRETQADSYFQSFHAVAKMVPVLSYVLYGLEVMGNLFQFLVEKMARIGAGNVDPVFKDRDTFRIGMFQSTAPVFKEIEKLKEHMQSFYDKLQASVGDEHKYKPR